MQRPLPHKAIPWNGWEHTGPEKERNGECLWRAAGLSHHVAWGASRVFTGLDPERGLSRVPEHKVG